MSLSGFNATTEMISSVREVQVNDFCAVAASALVVFEHLCTLSAEAKYMWGSNMNYIKVLFYLNRSAVLVMTVLNWMPTNGFASCSAATYFGVAMELLVFAVWAVFSAIRVYVLRQRGSKCTWIAIAAVVCALGLVPVATNINQNYIASKLVFDTANQGCITETTETPAMHIRLLLVSRVCGIMSDVIVLIVTWCRTFTMFQETKILRASGFRTSLYTMLLRDGTKYFLIILTINVLQIALSATNTFGFIMTNFSTPLSSIIVSRFLLDIRQAANAPSRDTLDSSLFGTVSDSAVNRRSQNDAVLFASRNIDVAISIENNTFAESKATASTLNTGGSDTREWSA